MKTITTILLFISVTLSGQTYAVLPSGKPVVASEYDLIDTTSYSSVASFERGKRRMKRGAVEVSKEQSERIQVLWDHYEKMLQQNTGIRRKRLKKLKAVIRKAIKEITNEKV